MMKRQVACSGGYNVVEPRNFNHRTASSSSSYDDDFLYVIVRAVSAGEFHGPNNNGDYFGLQELKRAYGTFNNRGVFVNHQSNDAEKCRGRIWSSELIEKPNEAWVKLALGVDRVAFPQLARAITKRYVRSVSMGATIGHSFCSHCGNEAHNESQICNDLRNFKGSTLQGKKVYEDNRNVGFFEISFVVDGADRDAEILEFHETLAPFARAANQQKQQVTASNMSRVASAGSGLAIGEVVEWVEKYRNANYTPAMIRTALLDRFSGLTEREADLALHSRKGNYQTQITFPGRSIPASILSNILNG